MVKKKAGQETSDMLKAESVRAQRYLDIAGVILIAIGADQKIKLINKKGCNILACEEEDVLGENWFDNFVPERIRDDVKDVFIRLMSGEIEPVEYFENPVITRQGEERIIAWHNTILADEQGNISGTLSSGEDITERRKAEDELRKYRDDLERLVRGRTDELKKTNDLHQVLTNVQSHYIKAENPKVLFETMLKGFLTLTESEYGFIGELLRGPDGRPFLSTFALTDVPRDKKSRRFYNMHTDTGMECRNFDNLFGPVVTEGRPVISNDLKTDPRSKGLPEGHPPIHSFMGLPFYYGEELVGMVGVANGKGGYKEEQAGYLRPLLTTCSNIINAYRIERQRKEIEQEIIITRDRLNEAQYISKIGNWDWDIVRNNLWWSDEIYRIFGLKPQEFGATYEAFLKTVHPADWDFVMKSVDDALNKKGPYSIEHRILLPDGTGKTVHEQAVVVFDKSGKAVRMTGTVQDITGRKKTEVEKENLIQELQAALKKVSVSQKEWHDTFDSIQDLVYISDRKHTLLKVNRAFAKYFGSTPKEIINKKCSSFFHEGACPVPECPHAAAVKNKTPGFSEFLEPSRNRLFKISSFPYYSQGGELTGTICIARDITDEREKELRYILSERLAALGQMSATIAHEINNPLAAISGCSEGLLKRVRAGGYERELFENYLSIIEEEVFRCKKITNELLSFVRVGNKEKEKLDIHALLDRTLELVALQNRMENIDIQKRYGDTMPVIEGSEVEMGQVFMAVITNALDAMGHKGTLLIVTENTGRTFDISIRDTGTGISKDHMHKIFEPFFTTKIKSGGTGLGLSIAKQIIQNHNGSLNVLSEEGKGATVKISLPY
ncbi:MAG: PAS domain S-box protein [Nitrospirae bacterium]|nr:PAS domain S-box protein [Nitrospirota bacterium]